MQEGSGCVDLKLDVSIHEGCKTQDESIRKGLASTHEGCKTQDESIREMHVSIHAVYETRMSRSIRRMCRLMMYR